MRLISIPLAIMGSSLKLELNANNYVLVTNSATQEQIEVTFDFIQKATKNSLSMLAQYKCYELILEAEKHWKNISKFQSGKEAETLRAIELDELEEIANIRSNVRKEEREKTAAKQQHWNEIAAYNQAQKQLREERIAKHQRQLIEQRIAKNQSEIKAKDKPLEQCVNNEFNILLKSQQSYNRALIALEYTDYCLEHDYRYSFGKGIDPQELSKEEQIIILQRENETLRKRIVELEAKYTDSASLLITEATDYIIGEIVN